PRRLPYAAALGGFVALAAVVSHTFTDFGHLSAGAVGLAGYPPAPPSRAAPGGTGRRPRGRGGARPGARGRRGRPPRRTRPATAIANATRCSESRIVTSGRNASPMPAQPSEPRATSPCARGDGNRRHRTRAIAPSQAAIIAERPKSGSATTEASAVGSERRAP